MSEKKNIRDPRDELTPVDKAKDLISNRQQAYQQTFGGASIFARTVLGDLARFCRANESCFHPDARMHAVLEGRREVYLRIKQNLEMSPDELHKIFLKET